MNSLESLTERELYLATADAIARVIANPPPWPEEYRVPEVEYVPAPPTPLSQPSLSKEELLALAKKSFQRIVLGGSLRLEESEPAPLPPGRWWADAEHPER